MSFDSERETVLHATDLRCQRLPNPMGVDAARPVFSWVPVAEKATRQTGYRVLVADDPATLAAGYGDLWDSGVVDSDEVNGVVYGGHPLPRGRRGWWTVRLRDGDGRIGPAAEPVWWEAGLLDAQGWHARWVSGIGPGPLLRTSFELSAPVRRARAYVSGLGLYELRINGARVGDRVLDPATSTYAEDPAMRGPDGTPARIRSARVLYSTYDVTDLLRAGRNAVGVLLGHGWFSAETDVRPAPFGRSPYGLRPRAIVQLNVETEDGRSVTVGTGPDWRTSAGPVVYNDLFHGEHHDATREPTGWDTATFDDSGWTSASLATEPVGDLYGQMMEPVRVVQTLAPKSRRRMADGRLVFDLGQHITGWTRIEVSGPRNARVTLRHAGRVDDAGELDPASNLMPRSPAEQTDHYVLAGDGVETWEPRFTLHGFQHVELSVSDPTVTIHNVEGRVVHNDVRSTGDFSCSHPLLDRLYHNVRWTLRASLQGIPQDAADRAERLAWLGDPGWTIEEYLYTFDTAAFWTKWLDDIRDCQLPDGSVPFVSPPHWRGPLPDALPYLNDLPYAGWSDFSSLSYIVLAWQLYRFTGDRAVLTDHVGALRQALEWTRARTRDHLLTEGFGEHMEPQPDGTSSVFARVTPVPVVATSWYHAGIRAMAGISAALGDRVAAREYDALAARVRAAFNLAFPEPEGQTGLALALWHDLVPDDLRPATVKRLADQVGHRLGTGTMGTAALEHVLVDGGAADTMFDVATRVTYPSWGHQIEQGATTVWETWGGEAERSRNMKLLASVGVFLFQDVAGISPDAPGWRRIRVRPALTHRLAAAAARVETPRGTAAVDWQVTGNELRIEVMVPTTATADVWLPTGVLVEGDGVVTRRDGFLVVEVHGGVRRFVVELDR
ncbi:family 78 glycoside hydrolase catalytic domain [Virgisporangium aurantiacum]|uniref:alpha-L-rhamnosidase n=1 Tax=Virgisporangium aurantiacum TaxID=175570 RepID=A0A8J3ZI19_9ACTN|nr:family 78 glycoside hydrolase catalytic domain [Virgisporangium aurantiacum]GIJ63198.1 alpha-rhamnosidase [Virgisporangium aurantiacum]